MGKAIISGAWVRVETLRARIKGLLEGLEPGVLLVVAPMPTDALPER
jgi:hypothetical protein